MTAGSAAAEHAAKVRHTLTYLDGWAEASHHLDALVALVSTLEDALREEMAWDMGGVPENEWMRRARKAEARVAALEQALREYESALRAICQSTDGGPWIVVYRQAGGGYEGLQAIASSVLASGQGTE